jgi:glycine hydroxymethyltransferase
MGEASKAAEESYAERLSGVLQAFRSFREDVVPLCAAETPISDYVRSFAASPVQEQYAMAGPLTAYDGNFIGSEHVLNLHQLIIDLCRTLYGASYADPRPSTGVGAVTNLLMTLTKAGQRIVLQSPDAGGHASMGHICRRLGLETIELPFDYERMDIAVDQTNAVLAHSGAAFLLLAPSDILYPPSFEALTVPEEVTILYDATQTLGLIASGALPNPIASHPRFILLGGTHKTLPGPSSGLIMTDDPALARQIDGELSPKYVRHSQPHQIASLAACLIEHLAIGAAYGRRIQQFSRGLSQELSDAGLEIIERPGEPTETHQVFFSVSPQNLDPAYQRFARAGITINKKDKRLFRGGAFRIGVQEIARYEWEMEDLHGLAALIAKIVRNSGSEDDWRSTVVSLARRNKMRPDLLIAPVR